MKISSIFYNLYLSVLPLSTIDQYVLACNAGYKFNIKCTKQTKRKIVTNRRPKTSNLLAQSKPTKIMQITSKEDQHSKCSTLSIAR